MSKAVMTHLLYDLKVFFTPTKNNSVFFSASKTKFLHLACHHDLPEKNLIFNTKYLSLLYLNYLCLALPFIFCPIFLKRKD